MYLQIQFISVIFKYIMTKSLLTNIRTLEDNFFYFFCNVANFKGMCCLQYYKPYTFIFQNSQKIVFNGTLLSEGSVYIHYSLEYIFVNVSVNFWKCVTSKLLGMTYKQQQCVDNVNNLPNQLVRKWKMDIGMFRYISSTYVTKIHIINMKDQTLS